MCPPSFQFVLSELLSSGRTSTSTRLKISNEFHSSKKEKYSQQFGTTRNTLRQRLQHNAVPLRELNQLVELRLVRFARVEIEFESNGGESYWNISIDSESTAVSTNRSAGVAESSSD